jgi:hemoglobin
MPPLTSGEPTRTDLATRADIEDVLRRFYGRVLVDDLLAVPFAEIRESGLESHLPIMCDFWETVLFGTRRYQGSALRVHRSVHSRHRLEARHFLRWLTLWSTTVGQMFHGPIAEHATVHATRIARAMHRNLTGTDAAELDALTSRLSHRVRDDHPSDRSPGGDLDDGTASPRRVHGEATNLPVTHHNSVPSRADSGRRQASGDPSVDSDASATAEYERKCFNREPEDMVGEHRHRRPQIGGDRRPDTSEGPSAYQRPGHIRGNGTRTAQSAPYRRPGSQRRHGRRPRPGRPVASTVRGSRAAGSAHAQRAHLRACRRLRPSTFLGLKSARTTCPATRWRGAAPDAFPRTILHKDLTMSEHIFHIALADDWEGAARFGEYEASTRAHTLDQIGFIHAATAEQLEHVLATVYGDVNLPLAVIVIDQDALRDAGVDVRWDEMAGPSGTPGRWVPRIMGAVPLDPDIVVATIPLEKHGGNWAVPDLSEYSIGEVAS